VALNFIYQIITQIFVQLIIVCCPILGYFIFIWYNFSSIPFWLINGIFNITGAISLASEFFTVVTLALLFCFLPLAYITSELFAKLGIYHPISKLNSPFGETLAKKFVKVYLVNIQLSAIMFIVIVFFVATIIQFREPLNSTDLFNLIISAIAICPAFLLSLRLLANPVRIVPKFHSVFSILNWIFSLSYLARPNDNFQTLRLIKERYVSLYFSMIATVLFTLMFLYVYIAAIKGGKIFEYVYSLFAPSILGLNPVLIVMMICILLLVLFFTTAIGEYFLKEYQVMEIDYEIIK
jgi:hypothetical protein